MTSIQNLHTAVGQLAYIFVRDKRKIQMHEAVQLLNVFSDELSDKNYDFNVSDIIFEIIYQDQYTNAGASYDEAMSQIRTNSEYLDPELKAKFIRLIETVAEMFKLLEPEKTELVEKFKADLGSLNGKPDFHKNVWFM